MALHILPIIGRDKEKETVKWFLKHAELIEKIGEPLKQAIDFAFLKKDFEKVEKLCEEINALEKEADIARQKTASLLYAGAFLPVMRSRFYDLSGRLDNVADTVQDAANILHHMKGRKIPKEVIKLICNLGEEAAKSTQLVKPALKALFNSQKNFNKLVEEIKIIEGRADKYEHQLLEIIFSDKKIEAVTVSIIKWISKELSFICDSAKHVSDTMCLLKIMNVA